MNKFFASIYKEILLISRDLGGLIILFVMPLVLVITVTLLQDGAFRNISQQQMRILLVDNDHGEVSQHIRMGIEGGHFFSVVTDAQIKGLDEQKAKQLVRQGEYIMAIVLPKHLSADLQAEVQESVDRILSAFMEEIHRQPLKEIDPKEVRLYFDPTLSLSYKEVIKTHIDKMMYQVENLFIYSAFEKELGEDKHLPFPTGRKMITFSEINPTEMTQLPNSVQHNVPAWALFAIFFITIPLSANIVREKTQGTHIRLLTSPLSYGELLMAKIGVFLLIGLLQFALMVLMGLYIFPLMGLPLLDLRTDVVSFFGSYLRNLGSNRLGGTLGDTLSDTGTVSTLRRYAYGNPCRYRWGMDSCFCHAIFYADYSEALPYELGVTGFL